MNNLLNELKLLSEQYEKLSDNLQLDDNEIYYKNIDSAIDDGKSQAYWNVFNDLNKLIKKYEDKNE